ncbi:hypothetical protein AVDCRST_MAG82-1455, partial [uncultured Rubrobacteraceae bacterium]
QFASGAADDGRRDGDRGAHRDCSGPAGGAAPPGGRQPRPHGVPDPVDVFDGSRGHRRRRRAARVVLDHDPDGGRHAGEAGGRHRRPRM